MKKIKKVSDGRLCRIKRKALDKHDRVLMQLADASNNGNVKKTKTLGKKYKKVQDKRGAINREINRRGIRPMTEWDIWNT